MTWDTIVIGSGIAGAATAARLAAAGRSVLVLEARELPSHKLCGEFLSPEVQRVFDRLGILGDVLDAGAVPIHSAVLTGPGGRRFAHELPGTALGFSRYALDGMLAGAARRAGAHVRTGFSVRAVHGSMAEGFDVEWADTNGVPGTARARTVVAAHGRRDRLDRELGRPDLAAMSPWVAFKAHYEGEPMPGVIELHTFAGGYCGLNAVETGLVNVCWIVHRDRLPREGGAPERAEAVLQANPALATRMAGFRRVMPRHLTASQLRFVPRDAWAGDVLLTGDAAGMIAPLAGDGMAMALDGSTMAARTIDRLLSAPGSAPAARRAYARDRRRAFARRLRIARWLHAGLTRSGWADAGLAVADAVPPLGYWLMRATRGA